MHSLSKLLSEFGAYLSAICQACLLICPGRPHFCHKVIRQRRLLTIAYRIIMRIHLLRDSRWGLATHCFLTLNPTVGHGLSPRTLFGCVKPPRAAILLSDWSRVGWRHDTCSAREKTPKQCALYHFPGCRAPRLTNVALRIWNWWHWSGITTVELVVGKVIAC